MRREVLQRFLTNTDETGRFIVKSSVTGITYYIEPLYRGKPLQWGDIDPATKQLTGNYGSKNTGAVMEKESLLTKENGFENIGYFKGSPFGEIDRRDKEHAENGISIKMKKLLFLDDIRNPIDVFGYTFNPLFQNDNWIIVRRFQDFKTWITANGLPDIISFDHDLADGKNENEKTGYDCAKWMVEYCLKHKKSCPDFICHSMNPVGKENIEKLLTQFKNLKQ